MTIQLAFEYVFYCLSMYVHTFCEHKYNSVYLIFQLNFIRSKFPPAIAYGYNLSITRAS